MYLKQLIEYLEQKDCDLVVPMGFAKPHSYRGDYMCLAFEPARNVTVRTMLQCARDSVSILYKGWNGVEYLMDYGTEVYLAMYGCSGEKIGTVLLDYMTGVYDSEECEHLRGVISRSTDEIAGLIAKIDEKNRLIVNDRDTLRSIERICVELEMCNPKAVSRDVKAIKSMKRISNIMEEWDPNIGREEESKSWWKNGYAIISAAIDQDEVINKQNQTLLHIKAELDAAKQYNPFDLVLMAGSMENISNVINGQTEPFIDEGCVESCKVCARSCKVVDIAVKLEIGDLKTEVDRLRAIARARHAHNIDLLESNKLKYHEIVELKAELSKYKEDSRVLMKVVDVIKDDTIPNLCVPGMVCSIVGAYLGRTFETPLEGPELLDGTKW